MRSGLAGDTWRLARQVHPSARAGRRTDKRRGESSDSSNLGVRLKGKLLSLVQGEHPVLEALTGHASSEASNSTSKKRNERSTKSLGSAKEASRKGRSASKASKARSSRNDATAKRYLGGLKLVSRVGVTKDFGRIYLLNLRNISRRSVEPPTARIYSRRSYRIGFLGVFKIKGVGLLVIDSTSHRLAIKGDENFLAVWHIQRVSRFWSPQVRGFRPEVLVLWTLKQGGDGLFTRLTNKRIVSHKVGQVRPLGLWLRHRSNFRDRGKHILFDRLVLLPEVYFLNWGLIRLYRFILFPEVAHSPFV